MPLLTPRANVPALQSQPQRTAQTPLSPLKWGIGAEYSYDSNDFMFDNSMDIMLGNEATELSQWITNALITPRFRYYIHGQDFGSDFDLIFAKNYPRNVVKNLSESYVRAALSVDPRIVTVVDVAITVQLRSLIIAVKIITRAGFEQQFVVQWSVP
jgi:hypothetical protein